jgi:SAM-dependent methyltransferase
MDSVWDAYLSSIGPLDGRTVLDFGCGEGWSTVEYCKRGATVYCFDISSESIRNLVRDAESANVVGRIRPAVMAAEDLGYPNETFDLVLGVSILHHTDVSCVGREIARVLKSGGRALFIEPLAHNIFLRIFRWLTPHRRTPTEQPMTVQQITAFIRAFRWGRYRGYQLSSIFPQGLFWLTGNEWFLRKGLRVTDRLDRWLLSTFPFLQRYCWAAVIEVHN